MIKTPTLLNLIVRFLQSMVSAGNAKLGIMIRFHEEPSLNALSAHSSSKLLFARSRMLGTQRKALGTRIRCFGQRMVCYVRKANIRMR
ncbi:hypothetical protein COX84_01135, partial [Candidatus Micrarchaeota archaeon CG_4_10_14_0_2_um_filter_49_7]